MPLAIVSWSPKCLNVKYCDGICSHSVYPMKDIAMINNKMMGTGIGNYSFNLYHNLRKISNRTIDFITLDTTAEDNYGSSMKIFAQKLKRIADHVRFIRKVSHSYKLYHVLNPNLGMLFSKHRPSIVTVFDIAALVPQVSREIIEQSSGLDIPLVLAMQLNMRFVRNADRILCMSNYTKNDLNSLLGIEGKRIIVGYPGIDRSVFTPRNKMRARQDLGLPLNRKILLHVGTDEPRKNSKTLIQAFHIVKKKIPEVVLVKIGGMREQTRKLILDLGLDQSVLYYKKVPDVSLYYNAADLFVFPSYYEGFGYPAAEAMASGCPVIAGNSSSVTEVVGKAGILFEPSDVITLYESICQVLSDPSMVSTMVKEGLEQVKMFDWKKCAETTLNAYETL